MARHSTNSTARGFHSRKELQKSRRDTDSVKTVTPKFGTCHLCFDRLSDTVATKSGHVYHRECIIKYMISKKQEIKQHNKVVEEQTSASEQTSNDNALVDTSIDELPIRKKRKQITDAHSTSGVFWLPENTPEATPAKKLKKLDKHPPSPYSSKPLRLKELIDVKIEVPTVGTDENQTDLASTSANSTQKSEGLNSTSFICHISKRDLVSQELVLDRQSGYIVERKAFELCVGPVEKHLSRALNIVTKPVKRAVVEVGSSSAATN